jgi:hypothetical protein
MQLVALQNFGHNYAHNLVWYQYTPCLVNMSRMSKQVPLGAVLSRENDFAIGCNLFGPCGVLIAYGEVILLEFEHSQYVLQTYVSPD